MRNIDWNNDIVNSIFNIDVCRRIFYDGGDMGSSMFRVGVIVNVIKIVIKIEGTTNLSCC